MNDLFGLVGRPDWRAVLLAVGFALPVLWLLARGHLKDKWLWLVVVLAAILFPLSIYVLQVPLQQMVGQVMVSVLGEGAISNSLILVGLAVLLVASAVQEAVKLGAAVALPRAQRRLLTPSLGLALGAAAGAGYGAFEAFLVLNNLFFVSGWSWATVDLKGATALLPFVERLFAVMLHIGTGAITVLGFASGRTWQYLAVAVGLHTFANFSALLLQTGTLGVVDAEVWVAVVAVASIGLAVILFGRINRQTSVEVIPES